MTTIVVVGDSTLDVDVSGEALRLSPEAPVPVISGAVEQRRPGGAALAALLAAGGPGSGGRVVLVTPLGPDPASAELGRLLAGRVEVIGLPTEGTLAVKTRWRAGGQAVARLDTGGENRRPVPLTREAEAAIAAAGAVLVSDYGRGAAAHPSLRPAISRCTAPVVWDPHPRGPAPVPGVTLVTPNAAEAAAASAAHEPGSAGTIADASRDAAHLVGRWRVGGVAVTLGPAGALLASGDGVPLLVPARAVTASDTCGAGDAFAAAATVSLAAGALTSEAVQAAVVAAGRFVAAGGAAGWSQPEALPPAGEDAVAAAARVRAAGGVVVATGGCFDLLHAGHVSLLEAARSLGDLLIVLLNSDNSVRGLKGSGRPLQAESDRAQVLASLRSVDHVVVFDEDTPVEALADLRPHLWVKGGDYTGGVLPEAEQLAGWGGQAVTVPFLAGRSTTGIVTAARTADLLR